MCLPFFLVFAFTHADALSIYTMMPSSSQKDHPVGLNTSPNPKLHFSLSVSPRGCGMSAKHNPPMNEIVVQRPPVPTRAVTEFSASPRVSARPLPPNMAQGPPPSAFRLQPRHPVKNAASLPEVRIRKRRAHSISESAASSVASSDSKMKQAPEVAAFQGTISTPLRESLTTGKTKTGILGTAIEASTTTTDVDTSMDSSSLYEEAESPAQVDTTAITLQGLSLQSPQTARHAHTDASPPLIMRNSGSTTLSSFSKFHASPTSIRFEESPKTAESPIRHPRTYSSASSKSSPKLAPLTVISHRENNMATPSSQRTSASQRPPLHGGASTLLFSLDATPRDSDDDEEFSTPKRPPPAVFCPNMTCSANSSISTIHEPIMYTGPSSKQARTAEFESPGKRSLMDLSPRTPLPKITLTPRSAGSRSSRLPRFPSPTDDVYNALTPMTLFSDRFWVEDVVSSRQRNVPSSFTVSIDPVAVPRHHPSRTTKSFIPMPDWNDGGQSECGDEGPSESHSRAPPFSRSIVAQSASHETSQLMLDEDEHGSLSDSDDDDEPFLLAVPGIIVEEKLQASHRHYRQRRCLVPKTTGAAAMPSVHPADRASCSSLFGMEFVTSSSELFGMDKSNSSNGNLQLSESSSSLRRNSRGHPKEDESPSSELELEIDGIKSGINDSPGRDLITPPINTLQAHSPPPLPPSGASQNRMEHLVGARNPSNGGYI
jgi:hypothetical protein